jgi:hypothetical protein
MKYMKTYSDINGNNELKFKKDSIIDYFLLAIVHVTMVGIVSYGFIKSFNLI